MYFIKFLEVSVRVVTLKGHTYSVTEESEDTRSTRLVGRVEAEGESYISLMSTEIVADKSGIDEIYAAREALRTWANALPNLPRVVMPVMPEVSTALSTLPSTNTQLVRVSENEWDAVDYKFYAIQSTTGKWRIFEGHPKYNFNLKGTQVDLSIDTYEELDIGYEMRILKELGIC